MLTEQPAGLTDYLLWLQADLICRIMHEEHWLIEGRPTLQMLQF